KITVVTAGSTYGSFKIISCLLEFSYSESINRVIFLKSYFPFAGHVHCRFFLFRSETPVLEHFCCKWNYLFVDTGVIIKRSVNIMACREAAYLRIEIRKVDKD